MSPVLASKNTHFDALLRGPSSRGVSSEGLNWKGFLLERHSVEPDERPESIAEGYILGPGATPSAATISMGAAATFPTQSTLARLPLPLRVSFRLYVNITASRLSCAHWSQRL